MPRSTVKVARGVLLLLVVVGFSLTTLNAQVSVNVNIGAPPPVVVHSPPTMLFLPEPAVYVAVGTPYDIFFIGGRYYYFHGSNWFWATGYGGPWVHVHHSHLPPGLAKHKIVMLRDYREREYRVYKVQGSKWSGKRMSADPGPHSGRHDNDNHQGNQGNGNGKGNGKGKGRK